MPDLTHLIAWQGAWAAPSQAAPPVAAACKKRNSPANSEFIFAAVESRTSQNTTWTKQLSVGERQPKDLGWKPRNLLL
jgi:hypothetical protein